MTTEKQIKELRKEVEEIQDSLNHIKRFIGQQKISNDNPIVLSGENIYEAKPKPDFKVKDWVIVLPEDLYYYTSDQGDPQRIDSIIKSYTPFMLECADGCKRSYTKIRHATDAEVKNHLEKEAIKRGFKVGIRFKSAVSENEFIVDDITPVYNSYDMKFFMCDEGCVWCDGTWATIIDDAPVINGHKMEIDGCYVKVGCKRKYFKAIQRVNEVVSMFNSFTDCQVTALEIDGEYKVTVDELKQIVERLNKKK